MAELKSAEEWCVSVHNADAVSRDALKLMIRSIQANVFRSVSSTIAGMAMIVPPNDENDSIHSVLGALERGINKKADELCPK